MAGFMCCPASAARRLPTGIEPVNVTNRTAGCGIRYSEISEGVPNTRLSTPRGTPASLKARTSCTAPAGVSSDAFKMMAQPADSAPATLRAGETHRKIPWRKRRNHADGLAQDGVPHAGLARDDAAVNATTLSGVPFDDVAGAENFEPGLSDWFALLQRHGDRHLLHAFAREPRRPEDDVSALGGRGMPPDPQPVLRGRQSGIEIVAGRVRYGAEDALVGGIEHRLAIRAFPFARDEKLQIRICRHCRVLTLAQWFRR
jgi:hypothetical protein